MKKRNVCLGLFLVAALLVSVFGLVGCGGGGDTLLPFPEASFAHTEREGVVGSIVQTGDGNAYVTGTVPAPRARGGMGIPFGQRAAINQHLVTLEHAYQNVCAVSGYIGESLYIIQDYGSLAWNKKGIGHKDGTVLLDYGEDGYFSISTMREGRVIVGNPTDGAVTSLWDDTSSYLFGYMIYDEAEGRMVPMYPENNLRFYTAGYFMDGAAAVSVKEGERILFGVIDTEGNYIVEPRFEMMADERYRDAVIVAESASIAAFDAECTDTCGRTIWYDSTLMTNVQFTRHYECTSSTVGLLNAKTGEYILPCAYRYIERVLEDLYFVIDNEGGGYLYDMTADTLTEADGFYAYFNGEWMLHLNDMSGVTLADRELALYEMTGIALEDREVNLRRRLANGVNMNQVSACQNEAAEQTYIKDHPFGSLSSDYQVDSATYRVTVSATGEVLENVRSYTEIYRGAFLYTVENSLYRYDIAAGKSTRLETGYGDFTEDYERAGATFFAQVEELDEGVYTLRYNIQYADGSSYFMVIINHLGEILYDAAINAVERLAKNYLGEYDDALYSLAGSTKIEDNYYLTRDDGAHFLLQLVRGEGEGSITGEGAQEHERTVDNLFTFSFLSPFRLPFAEQEQITVSVDGVTIPEEHYVYDSEARTFKPLTSIFGCTDDMLEGMRARGYLEILVTAGEETVTLKIKVSPFAHRF